MLPNSSFENILGTHSEKTSKESVDKTTLSTKFALVAKSYVRFTRDLPPTTCKFLLGTPSDVPFAGINAVGIFGLLVGYLAGATLTLNLLGSLG